jgi:hypothetical protein
MWLQPRKAPVSLCQTTWWPQTKYPYLYPITSQLLGPFLASMPSRSLLAPHGPGPWAFSLTSWFHHLLVLSWRGRASDIPPVLKSGLTPSRSSHESPAHDHLIFRRSRRIRVLTALDQHSGGSTGSVSLYTLLKKTQGHPKGIKARRKFSLHLVFGR